MKKRLFSLLGSGLLLSLTIGLLANYHYQKQYKYGDYVKELDSYFSNKVEDEAGAIKAHKFITPTDTYYNTQKNYSHGTNMVGDLENTWSVYTGKGTTVAIIDDGFDYEHPEYTRSDGTSAILSTSRNYYFDDNTSTVYYQQYSLDPSCIQEDYDSNEGGWATHGTNTSTTAAAPMNNGGGVGIAPEADILALKIDFSFAAIQAAIQYAVSQNVDVISMSLGAYSETFTDGWGDSQSGSYAVSTYLNSVCQQAYNAGIIVVAAAGNESTWHKSYPACNYKVIGVGALEENEERTLAAFTNYVGGSQTGEINVDILAPGYVYTAKRGGTYNNPTHAYGATQGTSFSCPIVAGAACLWKEKYPSGTPDQFLNALQSSATDIGYYEDKMVPVSLWGKKYSDVGPSNITCGRLNVSNLLDISEPFVDISQSSINVTVNETKQVELSSFNGDITYSIANTNIATVSNSGLVRGVAAGSTTLTVTATKNAKTATDTIPVVVSSPVACSSISISPTSVTLDINDTYEIEPTISVTPNNADRAFMFASNDEDVAIVDFETGELTAIGAGTTTIDIECLYGSGDATLTVNVNEPAAPTTWNKITDTNDLTNGDYLIVYSAGNKIFNGSLSTLDAVNNYVSVTINNDSITNTDAIEAAKFSINSITNGYSIQSASGYYIGRGTNSNGMDTSTSQAYVNTITFSQGNASITGAGGKKLCYNTAADQNRFRYMSSGGLLQLFKASTSQVQTVDVTGVSLNKSSTSLLVGNTETLIATVSPNDATNKNVTWSSNNESVATVTNGTINAISAGNATITVTTVDGGFTATCQVSVSNPTPTVSGVTLSEISFELDLSGTNTKTLTATVNGTYNPSQEVTWTSSNEGIATVSNAGVVTAIAKGNATITATSTYDNTKSASATVSVVDSNDIVDISAEAIFEDFGYTNGSVVSSAVIKTDCITVTFNAGSNNNAPKYYDTGNAIRCYGGNYFTVTSIKANIRSITLTFGSGENNNAITTDKGSYSNGAWTHTQMVNSVRFTIGGSSGNRRIASISVCYYSTPNFAEDFLYGMTCDNTGVNAPTNINWSNLNDKYDLLFSDDQLTLKNTIASKDGNTVQEAMARYDLLVKKYGYTNFISRSNLTNAPLSIINENNYFTLICFVSLASVSLLSIYFLIKKKRHI